MAYDVRTLDATWWAPKVGGLGEIVQDLDDISQCILTLLSTPLGSDPHRPDFAMDLFSYLDRPINQVRPLIVRDAIRAITRWEQRVKVKRVTVTQDEVYQLSIRVEWRLSGRANAQAEPQNLTTMGIPVGAQVVSPFVSIPFVGSFATLGDIDGGTV